MVEPRSVSVVYDYPMFCTPLVSITMELSTKEEDLKGRYSLYLDMEDNYLDDWFKYEMKK